MKTYKGKRTRNGCVVTVDGRPLNPRNDVRNHSPDGFEWGYPGSGPSQLALALVSDAMDVKTATKDGLYQDFKMKAVATIQSDTWTMTQDQIVSAVEEIWNGN